MLPGTAASAQTAIGYEEGIVEIVAERLAPLTTIVLVDSAASILLPMELVTRYLGFDGRWERTSFIVPRQDGGVVRVDTATGVLYTNLGQRHLTVGDLVIHDDIAYIGTGPLAALLDASVNVDMGRLSVVITRDTPFPAQQRIIAEQRRALLLSQQRYRERRDDYRATPYSAGTGAGILDWEIATTGLNPARFTTLRTEAGTALAGGDLSGGGRFQLGQDATDTFRDPTLRYRRVFPHGRYATQVQAGDVITNGLFARYMRGLEVTNRPFFRSGELSSVIVAPDLPAGWEYEVFQGNELLGYSDIGSVEPVSVRLRTGNTPVQVRMYGPAGEEVLSTLVYQMPLAMIPQDDIEYAVGGGRCSSGCESFVYGDIRYGASALFTIGGGFELVNDTIGSNIRPYFIYSMASGTRAIADITFMPFALYAADIGLFPREGSRAQLRSSLSRPGFGPVSLVQGTRMRWDTEVYWDEAIANRESFFSQLRFGAAAAGLTGSVDRWRISGSGSFRRGYIEARYDHSGIAMNRHVLSGRALVFLPFSFRQHSLRPLLNTALGVGRSGLQLAELGGSIQPRPSMNINAGVQWSRGGSRPTLSLGFSGHTGPVHSSVRAISSATGVASNSIMVRGSSSFVHDGSVTFQPFSRTGYAGLHGTAYIDHDGDGVFSEGDEVVPDVRFIVGGHPAVADDNGKYRVWSLRPYDPITIAIDSARTPDPSWTTRVAEYAVRPTPNMAFRTDIQLVRTRELIGMIEAGSGVPTAAGITIEITNLDTDETITTMTFMDGTFYISRVRPGRYRIAPGTASLDALRAASNPASIEFEIPAAGDDLVVELDPIRLERR